MNLPNATGFVTGCFAERRKCRLAYTFGYDAKVGTSTHFLADRVVFSSPEGDKTQALAFGGGSAQAFTADSKPIRPWVPSQKGLFSDFPQRHRPITVRPAKSKVLPSASSMVKEPSIRNGPLLRTAIFVLSIVLTSLHIKK